MPSSPADAPDTANTAMAISNTFIGRLLPAQIARELHRTGTKSICDSKAPAMPWLSLSAVKAATHLHS